MAYVFVGISDSQKKAPPLPPTIVSQSDSGSGRSFDDGATFLTFQDTTFDGKLPILDYTITATDELGGIITKTINTLTSTVLTGLKSGLKYTYKIKARNLVYSSDDYTGGNTTVSTVPGRVTSVGGTDLQTSGGITLSWVAPSNGGSPITGYIITPNVGAVVDTGNSSTSYTFSGLTVGTGYNFTVAAKNANGTGIASTTSGTVAPSNATAPVYVPTYYGGGSQSTLAAPTISATSIGSNSITAVITNYDGNNTYTLLSTPGSLSGSTISLSGLTALTNYGIVVLAERSGYYAASGFANIVTSDVPTYSGGGSTPVITYGPCTAATVKSNQTITTGCSGCNATSTMCYDSERTVYTDGVATGTTSSGCTPVCSTSDLGYSTTCCPITYTPTYSAPTCYGPCLGNWTIVNGYCQCVSTTPTFSGPVYVPVYTAPVTQSYYAKPPVVPYYAAPVTTAYYAKPPVVAYYAAPITAYYAARGGGCWAYGTMVTMSDGTTKPIEDIVKGDQLKAPVIPTYPNGEDNSKWYPGNVWSLDNADGITYQETTVVAVRHVVEESYYKLNGTMKITWDHFLFVSKNGVWQFARVEEIVVGDKLKREDGVEITITSKEPFLSQTLVVDIDVEANDLFLADGIITHNFKY
jgi:hypothetical protein